MDVSSLIIDVDVGESVMIGNAQIRLMYKSGRQARLHISAPRETKIEKNEGQSPAMRGRIQPS